MEQAEILPTFWIENPPYNWDSLGTAQSYNYKKGEVLFLENTKMNYIYLIKKGKVKLSITNYNGDEKTIGYIGENNIVGTASLFHDTNYIFNATTISDCVILKYNKQEFIDIVMSNEELMLQIFKIMSLRIRILTDHVLELSFNHSQKRLARAILDLSKAHGKEMENGDILINFTVTQQELAEIIGTTWVTVANNLKKLREKQIIDKKGKYYIVKNNIDLEKIAQ